MSEPKPESPALPRRDFFKEALAAGLGAAVGLAPVAAGLAVILDPIRRKAGSTGANIRVASLSALPADGVPRKFPVIASRIDAWNRYPDVPVGAVYLRRTGEKEIAAFNVACPHAGCFVDFLSEKGSFLCPCHNSTFAVDGKINDPKSPSSRGLDTLEVEIRDDGEVWVHFVNFLAGEKKKIPVS